MANKINNQENNSNKNHHFIDELIKKIDEKIAEIEKQEKLYQENDENN